MNLEEIKKRFEETKDHYSEPHTRGEEDVCFVLGDQWEDHAKSQRKKDGRPCLTENRMMPFVDQVVNSAREIRPAVRVSPVDDDADIETAKIFKGLVRNIERQSKADIAYDTAMQYAVAAGVGWIRINTKYADPMSFDQEIVIEAVPDWKSVVIDPSSTMPDGSDAEFGFVYTDMAEDAFKAEYPDAKPVSVDCGPAWRTEKKVRIAEFFYKKYKTETIYQCFLGNGTVRVLTKAQKEQIEAQGFAVQVLQERETKLHTVKWCKFSGEEILDETDWLGQYIPLVPVYGKMFWHKDKLESYSLITQGKDAQKRLNYWISASTEIIALQPKAPYIGFVGQFDSRKVQWQNAHRDNFTFLEVDPVVEPETGQVLPPPQRAAPITGSPAMFQEIQAAALGINATLGMYEEGRGDESNAISGVAVRARQIRGDKATFHFIDNLAASIRHVGIILIDLIAKVYSGPQIRRILGEDGTEKNVPVNQPFVKDDNGIRPAQEGEAHTGIYDLGAGKYDVDVDVGPSYANKQQEFVDIMTQLLGIRPELASIAGDIIVKSIGGPYADELETRIRATMPPELLADDPMAKRLEQAGQALQKSEDEKLTLLAALEDKKKNETFENSIKQGELKDKQANTQIKLMDTLAKIEREGGGSEQVNLLTQAVLSLQAQLEQQSGVIQGFLNREAQATGQPAQGVFPAQMA